MKMILSTPFRSFLFFIILANVVSKVQSSYIAPSKFLSITSRRPKCLSLTSTRGTTIVLSYATPDVVTIPSNHNHARSLHNQAQPLGRQLEDPIKHQMERDHQIRMEMEQMLEGGTKRWESHRHPRRIDDIQSDSSNIFIIIDNVPQPTHSIPSDYGGEEKGNGGDRIYESFEIVQGQGKIKYTLSNYDHVCICVKSMTASQWKPTFFGILVKEVDEVHMDLVLEEGEAANHEEEKRKEQMEMDKGREHLRWLERELHKLLSRVNSIERAYHTSKEAHGEFYSQSVQMHGRFKWFAVTQIVVLSIMGFLNAKTMIQSLKKRGIIY